MKLLAKVLSCLFLLLSTAVSAQHIDEQELEAIKKQLDAMLQDGDTFELNGIGELDKILQDTALMNSLNGIMEQNSFYFQDTSFNFNFSMESMDDLMKGFNEFSKSFFADTTLQNQLFDIFEQQGFDDLIMPMPSQSDTTKKEQKTYSF